MKFNIDFIRNMANSVEGFLTVKEGEFLFNTAKKCKGKGVIVEIGSWKGKSTVWLGGGSKAGKNVKIYAIDPHTGSSELKKIYGKIWTFDEFKKNIRDAKINDIIVPIIKTSKDAESNWNNKKIEFLWIDGAHEYEFANLDYKLWEPLLVDDGIIAFHDTLNGAPKKIVDKYLYKGDRFINVGFVNSITFGRKSKDISIKEKLKNRYVLFLREIYIFCYKLNLPKSVRMIGEKAVKMLQ